MDNLMLNTRELQEIRIRTDKPLAIINNGSEYFVSKDSKLTHKVNEAFIVSTREVRETMEYISNYSLYAFEEELKQGFITVSGGHRIGISGKVIIDKNQVKTIKNISGLNIRLSHQVLGCADKLIPFIINGDNVYHSLIISPPRCGKTTLLRDTIRQLSNGNKYINGMNIGVVDERSEICASYLGCPQNDVGIRTDVLDSCPKELGMLMLIRSMSPAVVAIDEIGKKEDIDAMKYVINSGCTIIGTVHGNSFEDIKNKPVLAEMVRDKVFERYIVLSNRIKTGYIEGIYDTEGTLLESGVNA